MLNFLNNIITIIEKIKNKKKLKNLLYKLLKNKLAKLYSFENN